MNDEDKVIKEEFLKESIEQVQKHKSEKTFIDEYGTIPEDVKEEFNKLFDEIATETKVISTDKATKSQTEEYARLCWLKLQETEEE